MPPPGNAIDCSKELPVKFGTISSLHQRMFVDHPKKILQIRNLNFILFSYQRKI
jgi:hypothetical protein